MRLFKIFSRSALLGARHQPSKYNREDNGHQSTFADYVSRTRHVLRDIHADKSDFDLERIVDGNAPFALEPPEGRSDKNNKIYQRGVLLTHGLSDSPYFMRHLGAFFRQKNFRVMAILLPGHGTQPGDLLNVSWREWSEAVADGVDRLAAEVEEVYLAGFSAGGTLSIYQSLHDQRVCGLFLFSPALRISPWAALARFHKLYSWLIPAEQWLDLQPDHDIYKYESFPKNAVAQMYSLIKETQKLLSQRRVDIPIFAVASADDTTVDTAATLELMAKSPHSNSKLVLYAADRNTISSSILDSKLEWVNSVFPDQRILSFSHTAVVLPAEDTHYGLQGVYSNCIHYYPDDIEKYAACNNNPQTVLQGELTEKNLRAGLLRRLMYNPNFSELTISMGKFIDGL